MRCPNCNKFVSYEGGEEPEIDSVDLDVDTGIVTAEVRVAKRCGECGTDLKEGTFSLEGNVPEEFYNAHKDDGDAEHCMEAENGSCEQTEETDNPGRPARYQRMLYGVELEVNITCSVCDESTSIMLKDSMPASSFDEMV